MDGLFFIAKQELLCVRRDSRLVENEGELAAALVRERGGGGESEPLALLDRGREPVVAELAFNRETGQWVFHRLREKRTPNHVTVGFNVMEQMMERPLELAELITRWQKK